MLIFVLSCLRESSNCTQIIIIRFTSVKRRKSWSGYVTYGLQFISAIIFGITIALVIRFYEVSFMIIAAVCSIVILGFIFTHHEILRDIQKQIHKKTEKSNSDDLREDDEKSKGFWDTDMDKKVL